MGITFPLTRTWYSSLFHPFFCFIFSLIDFFSTLKKNTFSNHTHTQKKKDVANSISKVAKAIDIKKKRSDSASGGAQRIHLP